MSARCNQLTAAGKPCRNHAKLGVDRCSAHLKLVGAKTKLTMELLGSLEALLRRGVPVTTAIAVVGVAQRTYYEWMQKGEQKTGDPVFVIFRDRVEIARGLGEANLVAQIAAAGPESWQAAAFLLERGAPERWARISQREQAAEPPADPFSEFDELAVRRSTR